MLTYAKLQNIKLIRKLTGLSVSVCRTLLSENGWNVDLVLSNLPRRQVVTEVPNGNWYVGCVNSRFAVYLFTIYANSDIYNNRCLWLLRTAMNELSSEGGNVDTISPIKKMISEGVMIYARLTFSRSNGGYGLYRHGEISHFVHKMACLLFVSSFECSKSFISELAQTVSQHLMCYAVCNSNEKLVLSKALNSAYIHDITMSANEVLLKFCKTHLCKLNIQRAFALIQMNKLPSQ
ncbi:MAG: hypothetical protein ACTS80_00140 [Candidatus Hodgkinia cicadicola]